MIGSPNSTAVPRRRLKKAPREPRRSIAGQMGALGLGARIKRASWLKQGWSRIVPSLEKQKCGPKAALSPIVSEGTLRRGKTVHTPMSSGVGIDLVL
jgi:hypothetical protein